MVAFYQLTSAANLPGLIYKFSQGPKKYFSRSNFLQKMCIVFVQISHLTVWAIHCRPARSYLQVKLWPIAGTGQLILSSSVRNNEGLFADVNLHQIHLNVSRQKSDFYLRGDFFFHLDNSLFGSFLGKDSNQSDSLEGAFAIFSSLEGFFVRRFN